MVDQVTNAAISTMLRAQSVGSSASPSALKNNKQAAQAVMAQLSEGAPKTANTNALNKVSTSALSAAMTGSSDLPRGSLVDMLV